MGYFQFRCDWVIGCVVGYKLMINLCRPMQVRLKNKSMFPANKAHIASMNLRTAHEQADSRTPLHEERQRSAHKVKKSILHDAAFQQPKHSIDLTRREDMATQRLSKDRPYKQKRQQSIHRLKTDMDEVRFKQEQGRLSEERVVEVGVQELRDLMGKLRLMRGQKEMMLRELGVFKRGIKHSETNNAVMKALA